MEHTSQTYQSLLNRNLSSGTSTFQDDVAPVEPLTTETRTCDVIYRFLENYYCPLIVIIVSITVIALIIANLRNL